ncbi:MAG: phosphatidate cytidylyltransferase [Deltaproteobacteria bacterium]|nr:phosphatidate cytidylyltransferase [Deltaproteobacteria bacterium]
MLRLRLLTALFGLPCLLSWLIFMPSLLVSFFFLVCVSFSIFELGRMLYPAFIRAFHQSPDEENTVIAKGWPWFCILVGALVYCLATMYDLSGSPGRFAGAERGGIIVVFILVMILGVFTGKTPALAMTRITCVIFSLVYGCLPWLSVWDLYKMGEQARYVLLMLAIVFMGDSGAYFAGRFFGKHKLAPDLSPKKTWEGVAGGVLASIIGAWIMNAIFGFSMGPWWLIMFAALLGNSAGVMGDLAESSLKRFAAVKDSGDIFPGHGGFLDRCDSVLFAAPLVWLVFYTWQNLTFH